MSNAINWFEIPVKNFERAKKFYVSMLDTTITDYHGDDMKYGIFKYDEGSNGVSGALVEMEGAEPSANGITLYLNGGNDLSVPLSRVEPAGGKIVMPKTHIGEHGYMALLMDTEGNKIALHSMN